MVRKRVGNVKKRGDRIMKLIGFERRGWNREYDKKLVKSRIYIGDKVERWGVLNYEINIKIDEEMVDMLIGWWV